MITQQCGDLNEHETDPSLPTCVTSACLRFFYFYILTENRFYCSTMQTVNIYPFTTVEYALSHDHREEKRINLNVGDLVY